MQVHKIGGILTIGLLLFSALISCKSGNSVNPPVPVKTELEGTWSGTNIDGIDPTVWTYAMTLDSIIIDADAQEKYRGVFTLDTSASPRQININITKSSASSSAGKTIPALYALSENILLITANEPGSPRPASMDAAPVIRLTLQQ